MNDLQVSIIQHAIHTHTHIGFLQTTIQFGSKRLYPNIHNEDGRRGNLAVERINRHGKKTACTN